MLSFVKLIEHPSSASTGMDNSGVSISLKGYVVCAVVVSSGISNFVIASVSMKWLLAQITCLLSLFGKKYPVAPESATELMYAMSSSIVASALLCLFVLKE